MTCDQLLDETSCNKNTQLREPEFDKTTTGHPRSSQAAASQMRRFRLPNPGAEYLFPHFKAPPDVGRRIEQVLVCLDSEGHSRCRSQKNTSGRFFSALHWRNPERLLQTPATVKRCPSKRNQMLSNHNLVRMICTRYTTAMTPARTSS